VVAVAAVVAAAAVVPVGDPVAAVVPLPRSPKAP